MEIFLDYNAASPRFEDQERTRIAQHRRSEGYAETRWTHAGGVFRCTDSQQNFQHLANFQCLYKWIRSEQWVAQLENGYDP